MSAAAAIKEKEKAFSAGLKVVAVAFLFAACGALSSYWLLPDFPDRWELLFPLPFALLCTVVFMRKAEAVLAIALAEMVWLISSFAAHALGMWTNLSPLPGFGGGLVGGLGLVVFAAICHPYMSSLKRLAYGGLIGSLTGLAFTPWTHIYMVQHYGSNINRAFPKTVPILAFAVWQAAMGTYLYVIVGRPARSRTLQDSSEVL